MIKSRDLNTNYFHKQDEARRNYKTILEIQTGNQVIQEFDQIKLEATRHFKAIYLADVAIAPPNAALLELIPNLVKRNENNGLMQRITLTEQKSVVESMEEHKAPGLDGFNAKFVKVCWDIVHKDMMIKSRISMS